MKKVRCAIYTRKSSEEGLDQDFNSLDAQREACEAYVASQKHEGWVTLPGRYDDGGVSGGTLDRSGLQRLLQAIDDGLVDQIIVYKIDRLTRSLMDFSRLIERLDAADASFVSVTQSFNTATSMGRLTLNVLLSFAQFEREVTAERIRDKIAASKKKGMWMGGPVPLGYRTEDTNLIINEGEAVTVRLIYDSYQQEGTVRGLKQALDDLGIVSRRWITKSGNPMGGQPYSRGHLHRILTNPIFVGNVSHKGKVFEGQHEGIIPMEQWQSVQDSLTIAAAKPRATSDPSQSPSLSKSATEPSPLVGKLFDETGDRLTPSHANKKGRRYRYYISNRLIKRSGEKQAIGGWRLPAKPLEETVVGVICSWLNNPTEVMNQLSVEDQSADQLAHIIQGIDGLNQQIEKQNNPLELLKETVLRATLGEDKLTLELDRNQLVCSLKLTASPKCSGKQQESANGPIVISAPFQHRKRGVESKLMLGSSTSKLDRVLMTNIAKAREWLNQIKTGTSFTGIAASEGRSVRQIQRHLELAFLSPKLVTMVTEGTQPPELTSRILINITIPMDWDQQHRLFKIDQ